MPLPKQNRISKRSDIKNLLQSRNTVFSQHFRLKSQFLKTESFRAMIVVSKKIHKKANVRNKIRRKISSYLEIWYQQKSLPAGLQVGIFVQKNIFQTNYKFDLEKEIQTSLAKAYQQSLPIDKITFIK